MESEGSIGFQKSRLKKDGTRRLYLALSMGMHVRDRDVVERFHRVVGVGKVYGPGKDDMLRWRVTGKKAMCLAETTTFTSQLGARRSARLAEVLTAVSEQPPPISPTESGRRGGRASGITRRAKSERTAASKS